MILDAMLDMDVIGWIVVGFLAGAISGMLVGGAGQEADDDPTDDVHVQHGVEYHMSRNARTALTTSAGWVW